MKIDELNDKIEFLSEFTISLRNNPDNEANMILADALEAILRKGASGTIETAYNMCEEKFGEV